MIPWLNNWLKGKPSDFLTATLIFISGVALTVALFAPDDVKFIFAAWFLFP